MRDIKIPIINWKFINILRQTKYFILFTSFKFNMILVKFKINCD